MQTIVAPDMRVSAHISVTKYTARSNQRPVASLRQLLSFIKDIKDIKLRMMSVGGWMDGGRRNKHSKYTQSSVMTEGFRVEFYPPDPSPTFLWVACFDFCLFFRFVPSNLPLVSFNGLIQFSELPYDVRSQANYLSSRR